MTPQNAEWVLSKQDIEAILRSTAHVVVSKTFAFANSVIVILHRLPPAVDVG